MLRVSKVSHGQLSAFHRIAFSGVHGVHLHISVHEVNHVSRHDEPQELWGTGA